MSVIPDSVPPGFDEYQAERKRTAGERRNRTTDLSVAGLGIAGEAGEVADLIKKHIGHDHELDVAKITDELGDVLWYVARLADLLGVKLSEVARANSEKLDKRYPDGFSAEISRARYEAPRERWDVV